MCVCDGSHQSDPRDDLIYCKQWNKTDRNRQVHKIIYLFDFIWARKEKEEEHAKNEK